MWVKKNYRWIWIAVNRYEKKFINFIVGDGSAQTGQKLWNEIEDQIDGKIATDYWQPYEHFIPEKDHVQSKAETYTVEGYNSIFRHFLARMRRKTTRVSLPRDRFWNIHVQNRLGVIVKSGVSKIL